MGGASIDLEARPLGAVEINLAISVTISARDLTEKLGTVDSLCLNIMHTRLTLTTGIKIYPI